MTSHLALKDLLTLFDQIVVWVNLIVWSIKCHVIFPVCICFTNITFNCFWLGRTKLVFSLCFEPFWGCFLTMFAGGSMYSDCNVSLVCVVECVWRVVRSALPSAPLFPSCRLKCVALVPPVPPIRLHSQPCYTPIVPPFLSSTSFRPLSRQFFVLHSPSTNVTCRPGLPLSLSPSLSVLQVCLYWPVLWELHPHYALLQLFSFHDLELDAAVEECVQGWRSTQWWAVKYKSTTCVFCLKEAAILWCEDRWLSPLIIFSITSYMNVSDACVCVQRVEVGSLRCSLYRTSVIRLGKHKLRAVFANANKCSMDYVFVMII